MGHMGLGLMGLHILQHGLMGLHILQQLYMNQINEGTGMHSTCTIHELHMKKNGVLFKIDFEKAYDKVK
jgi:hypothetical protein